MPKLYELKRGAVIVCPMSIGVKSIDVVFDHVDGMYSLCSSPMGPVHLAASTPLVQRPDGKYEIDAQ